MRPRELNRLQLELECIGVDDGERLHRIAGADPDDSHLVFLARYEDEVELFVRDDADPTVVREVESRSVGALWERPESVAEYLYGSSAPSDRWWRGWACTFTEPYPRDSFPLAEERGGRFVVTIDGRVVSWAESSRRNDRCAELGTETAETHQRRGYAMQVCRAWANSQLGAGRVPFYSYHLTNTASAGLAAKLGVRPFMECISYS